MCVCILYIYVCVCVRIASDPITVKSIKNISTNTLVCDSLTSAALVSENASICFTLVLTYTFPPVPICARTRLKPRRYLSTNTTPAAPRAGRKASRFLTYSTTLSP